MRQLYTFLLTGVLLIAFTASGQVTVTNPTNTTPNLAATYTSLANAITALNGITAISGPVTISLTAGNNQTTPSGGYVISFAAITTAATPITISGNSNTITAFTPQVTGSLNDAIFKIIGADYIRIQNFVMQENPANTTTGGLTPQSATIGNNMTEWGVALLYASTSNGAQNNTIINNFISLDKTYRNTFGIYSNTRHTATVISIEVPIVNNTTAPNKNNKFYGNTISNVNMGITLIGSGVADNMDTGNDIGGVSAVTGNSITNWGGTAGALSTYIANTSTLYGIYLNHQKDENVGYNTISTTTLSASGSTLFRGILKDYSTALPVGSFSSIIRNNTITIIDNFTNSHTFQFIRSEGITTLLSTASISIINNQFINNVIAGATTSIVNAISNASLCGTLNINNNILRGTVSAATGTFSAVSVTGSGSGATTVNINNNQLGNAVGGAVRFTAINSATFYGVNYNSTASATNLSISNNNFQGFVHDVTSSGIANMIYFNNAPGVATTTNINSNSFTNLEFNNTGGGYLIRRTGTMALNAGATENCNNNSIVTGLQVPVSGGIFSMYSASSSSTPGNFFNFTGNNFSNVAIVDAFTVDGCYLNEGLATAGPTKTISNNIFNNWNVGTSPTTMITASRGGDNSVVSGNTISNITGSGIITGISLQSSTATQMFLTGNTIAAVTTSSLSANLVGIFAGTVNVTSLNIGNNIISGFNSSSSSLTAGIRMLSMKTVNLFKNKIYDLSSSSNNNAVTVSGIEITTGSTGTFNISNNLLGNYNAAFSNNTNAIRGLNILSVGAVSNLNAYYNTIYLNATSSGTDFGTSGIFLTVSATTSSMAASIRNNIIINRSTANGTGLTVAYRRSGPQLNNYAASSNNNIYYAGVPSATNLIYYDGTNSDQTLGTFKTRVGATRETSSYTELPTFLSLSGASANFLHLNPAVATLAESRAVNIATYTDDYDGQIRQGNAGYAGTGTAPDIGADEVDGILSEPDPPVIIYTPVTSPNCNSGNMSLTGVTITDATGVPLTGANRPRIYYRKNSGSWFSQPGTNTAGTAINSTWTFTIVVADMGGVTAGDAVSYYLIAQDILAFPNVISNPSAGAVSSSVNAVSTAPTSPNIYTVAYTLSGTYTVGVGGDFTTLTAAVIAYNTACALNSAVVFELIDNSYPAETFPISVLLNADASAVKTLTIRPSATSVPLITGASLNPIISLNGANYVLFDGRQAGAGTVKSLGISNTSGGITVQFINDAQLNTFKFCMIKGQNTGKFGGTIVFSTAGSGTGNDLNSIENNDISEAGGFSNNGIYSEGTLGKENDNNSILNNNIFNYFDPIKGSHGIYINTNTSGWTISGNRFYQTATRVYTSIGIHMGIYINKGSGYNISNNIIGFANSSSTGTTNMIGNSIDLPGFPGSYSAAGMGVDIRFIGIYLSDLNGTQSNVDGNTVAGFAVYTASSNAITYGVFCGIYIESGNINVGFNVGNTIGSETGTNSIYVITSGSGGTIMGIRTACSGTSVIQNNKIGSILVSGINAAMAPAFTGISFGGVCNYTVTNNIIGNANPDNIRLGYALSLGFLSNAGTLNPINASISTLFKGIISTNSFASLSITDNILRGWSMSCPSVLVTGIESSGFMLGNTVNINGNSFGTATTNWVNATVDNASFFYGINVSNTSTAVNNIQNNNFQGSIFGAQNGVGGGLIKLTGATSPGNVATISGNKFTNLSFRFTTGDLYFIFANYSIAASGKLFIDNNQIVGSVTATGNAQYHMVDCAMNSSTGSQVSITNNNFSNFTTATGFNSDFYGIYTFFNLNFCQLTVTGNILGNWSYGPGGAVGIEMSTMTGTANCSNNSITNITSQGDVEGISLSSGGSTGQFTVANNTINSIVSSGAGGFVYGISAYLPSLANTTQTIIDNNRLNGFSSTNNIGIIAGIFLDNGHASSTVSVLRNKIYDLSGSKAGSRVYGITNHTTLAGTITYTNNYIGDLRAPIGNTTVPCIAGIKIFSTAGEAKVFYNSIHLNATGSGAQFSTAAIFADASTALNLRNNILSNISTPGVSGRTVAYWRSNTSLAAYNAASNNNLFYAGIASAQKLIYYDGTNSDQTLATYKARVTVRDNLSVSILPAFISTTGASADFLHLAASGNCAAASGGNNAGILLATDFDGDSRSVTSPFLTDIGADEVTKVNIWTGANSSNWNNAGNWSDGIVPNTTEINAFISNVPATQPIIASGESFQVSNLIVESGASLTNHGILKVSGGLYAGVASINNIQAGVIEGSIEVNGNCAAIQQLSGAIFTNNSIKNFTVSNDVSISSLPNESLNISRELSFGAAIGKTLFTGDNIVLLSTKNATANVAVISGNIISGKATVERYINTGLPADGRHPKSWQFLATPTVGPTIFESWQESGATPAGYGTWITGTGTGFDAVTLQPSIKYYDYLSNAFTGVSSTSGLLNEKKGYMIYVRGDRSVTGLLQDAVPTNLRSKGTLYQPSAPPPVTTVQAGKLESVGNPYASSINLVYMKNNGLFVNLNNDVTVWDPLLAGSFNSGGYQTLSAANNYEPTAGGTPYYLAGTPYPFIESGQAFFVKSSGPAGSVTFSEDCKESSNRLVNRTPLPSLSRQFFRASLFTGNGILADGNAVAFDPIFANIIDKDDAQKISNAGENFGLMRNDQLLSVEARRPVSNADTLYYQLSNLRKQQYQLRFAVKNMPSTEFTAWLADRFLQTNTQVSLTDSSFVNFLVNNDPASYAGNRFYLVFKKRITKVLQQIPAGFEYSKNNSLPINDSLKENLESGINIYPNPVESKTILIYFTNQEKGAYNCKLVNNLGNTVYTSIINVGSGKTAVSLKLQNSIATGMYYLDIYDEKGRETRLPVIIR